MKVVICGAGQVGFGIAERIAAEKNDVSIIDTSARLIAAVSQQLDVRGFVGNGAQPDVLMQAGAEHADMLIAVTQSDEVNMVACQVAHSLFNVPTKVARVRGSSYLDPKWRDLYNTEHLPIDVIISPELEVAEMVLRRVALPGAVDTASFAEGEVIVCGVSCEPDCPLVDTPLKQLTDLFPDLRAVIIGIERAGRAFVPRSDDQLLVGDLVYVASPREQVARNLSLFGHDEQAPTRIVIAGGGNIGAHVALALEERFPKARLKLIEASRDRAVDLAEKLARTVVLHGSALDREILEEADVETADLAVALTNDDQVNMLSSVMARRLGTKRNLCLINNATFQPFARTLGIDAYVNPRAITVSRILQHVRRGRIRSVYSVLDGKAEVIEAEALDTSPLVGKPLRDLPAIKGMRFGAIWRGGKVIAPRGDTVVQAKDRVVIFALREQVRQVELLFRVSLEFF
jgi:trk system potassium uptake protein TrkA